MDKHPIEALMGSVIENLKKLVDSNTVIGEPINTPNGPTIVPITKLSCGFGVGGGEYNNKVDTTQLPFGGGCGAGMSIQPVGFLTISGDGKDIGFLPLDGSDSIDKLISMVPKVIDKFTNKKSDDKKEIEIEITTESPSSAQPE